MREDPKKYGDQSEDLATAFLEQESFIILERNYFNSAHYYMKTKNLDVAFSIDALIIRHDEVEFIENVTL